MPLVLLKSSMSEKISVYAVIQILLKYVNIGYIEENYHLYL